MRLYLCIAVVVLAMGSGASADEEYLIANAGISRLVSRFAGPLRTNKIEIDGVQFLAQPGVEFQIDLDYKGEPVSLVPGDFDVKNVETIKSGNELHTSLRLQCHRDGLPLLIYVRYYRDPKGPYQQKSIVIPSFKGAPGAVLRRVVVEDLLLSPEFEPVAPLERCSVDAGGMLKVDASNPETRFAFGSYSTSAAFDRKAKKGVYFFLASPTGRQLFVKGRGLTMWENVYVPLDKGYETGRATIGSAAGSPEVLFKGLREFLWGDFCALQGKRVKPGDAPVTLVHKADVAADKVTGISGVLSVDLDEWKLAGALASGWLKQADYQAVGEFQSACEKLRKVNPDATIRLVAPGPQRPDLLHWLGVVDEVAWAADRSVDSLTSSRLRYVDTLTYPPLTLGAAQDAAGKLLSYCDFLQHVFGLPDGKSVEGKGHIVDNKGFITLLNPSGDAQRVAIPLDEPELGLRGTLKLADWTNPDSVVDMGTARIGEKVEIDLPAGAMRVIGVNLPKSP